MVFIILITVIFLGCIWLQIFLSKKDRSWLGFILPFLVFCLSLFFISLIISTTVSTVSYIYMSKLESAIASGNSNEIEELEGINIVTLLGIRSAAILLLLNIPTAILLIIKYFCQRKRKVFLALKKMNVQDLG